MVYGHEQLSKCESRVLLDLCQNRINLAPAFVFMVLYVLRPLCDMTIHVNLITKDACGCCRQGFEWEWVTDLQEILEKAGKLSALGPLDNNDADGAFDEEEDDVDEDAEAKDEDDDGLADQLASTHIA
jgi:hypothetical protein